jgi:integrase
MLAQTPLAGNVELVVRQKAGRSFYKILKLLTFRSIVCYHDGDDGRASFAPAGVSIKPIEAIMIGQPAKVLGGADIRRALRLVAASRHPERNTVMLLLSAKAGLRACEIARLTWSMVTDSRGRVATIIELPARAAKKGSGRRIPLNPMLKKALISLIGSRRAGAVDPVVLSERGRSMTPGSVVNWFAQLYAELGLIGCSSHSGRRTFITQAARLASAAGGSLRDVQLLAGHRSLKTTQTYIDGSEAAQLRLVRLI